MLARELARSPGAPGRDCTKDRPVLELVPRVELVELCSGAPDPLTDERPAGALGDPFEVRHRRHPVDDFVKRVVPCIHRTKNASSRSPSCVACLLSSSVSAENVRSASSSASRSEGVIRGVATSVARASS